MYIIIHRGKVYRSDSFDFAPGMMVIDTVNDLYYVGGKWIGIN